jgi:hypothetical protein
MNDDLLIIFAREPIPGIVKTRLAKDTGAGTAAAIYGLMLRHIVKNAASSLYDIELWKTLESSRAYFTELIPGAVIRDQPEGNIGEKMSEAFCSGFTGGYRKICVIGTDCPGASSDDIVHALDMLDKNDIVLGPSFDGGYYLIGLSKFHPELFEGISWSTGSVFSETVKKARFLDIGFTSLCTKMDIDDLAGLTEYILKNPGTELAAAFENVLKKRGHNNGD